jgi:hypothetical protein
MAHVYFKMQSAFDTHLKSPQIFNWPATEEIPSSKPICDSRYEPLQTSKEQVTNFQYNDTGYTFPFAKKRNRKIIRRN